MTVLDEVKVIDNKVVGAFKIIYDSKTMYPRLIGKTGIVQDIQTVNYETGARTVVTVKIDYQEYQIDSVHVAVVCPVCEHMGCRGGQHTYNETCLCKPQFGIFNDESESFSPDDAVEADFSSKEEAEQAIKDRYSPEDELTVHECE